MAMVRPTFNRVELTRPRRESGDRHNFTSVANIFSQRDVQACPPPRFAALTNNSKPLDILGWLTVIMDAKLIQEVLVSGEGLQNTGETLLIGPVNNTNRFSPGLLRLMQCIKLLF